MSDRVLILGAGVAGLTVAWRLAQAGRAVMVIDRGPPGAEASGAAAGILSAQAEAEAPGPFFELLWAAERSYPAFLAELASASGQSIPHRRRGVLQVAETVKRLGELAGRLSWQLEAGAKAEQLDPSALRALEPALAVDLVGAIHFPEAGQVDNRALLRALAEAVRRAGATVVAGEVLSLELSKGGVAGVRLTDRVEPGASAVLAAGAWSSRIAGTGLRPEAVVPVRGQMLRIFTKPAPLQRVVYGAGGYLVPRWDDDTYVGSTMERVGFDKGLTPQAESELRARAARLCPALAESPIAERWAGLRPATADGLPALGPTPIPGLHLAVGLLRNGILLGPLVGELVARAILGEAGAIPSQFRAARLYGG